MTWRRSQARGRRRRSNGEASRFAVPAGIACVGRSPRSIERGKSTDPRPRARTWIILPSTPRTRDCSFATRKPGTVLGSSMQVQMLSGRSVQHVTGRNAEEPPSQPELELVFHRGNDESTLGSLAALSLLEPETRGGNAHIHKRAHAACGGRWVARLRSARARAAWANAPALRGRLTTG